MLRDSFVQVYRRYSTQPGKNLRDKPFCHSAEPNGSVELACKLPHNQTLAITPTCVVIDHATRGSVVFEEVFSAGTSDYGHALDARRVFGSRNSGTISRKEPSRVHHRSDDGVSPGSEEGCPPRRETPQSRHLRGFNYPQGRPSSLD